MQAILENENERSYSGRIDSMGVVICARRVSRYIERKYIRRLENRRSRVWISERILARVKKEFGGEDEESVKVAELRRLEQEERIMEKFV